MTIPNIPIPLWGAQVIAIGLAAAFLWELFLKPIFNTKQEHRRE